MISYPELLALLAVALLLLGAYRALTVERWLFPMMSTVATVLVASPVVYGLWVLRDGEYARSGLTFLVAFCVVLLAIPLVPVARSDPRRVPNESRLVWRSLVVAAAVVQGIALQPAVGLTVPDAEAWVFPAVAMAPLLIGAYVAWALRMPRFRRR